MLVCDRAIAAASEFKANVSTLANCELAVRQAQDRLAALNGQITEATRLASQLEQVEQAIRSKRSELADLDAVIARKHADHGEVTSALRDLRKKISGDVTHA
jgi:chromosome segregation ATPase